MESELSFLLDLFLNDELPSGIRKTISERIKEVEKYLNTPQQRFHSGAGAAHSPAFPPPPPLPPGVPPQSPSMMRIMAKNPDLVPGDAPHHEPVLPLPPDPPAPAIGQTPAAVAALAQRNQLIAEAVGGKQRQKGYTNKST